MYRSLIFLLVFHQTNSCLDLLVRSFNEVFSPMIETGDGRIRKPHRVDDLTNYYTIDESGNIIPNTELVSSSHLPANRAKSPSENEDLLLQPRNPYASVERTITTTSAGSDNQESSQFSNLDNAQEQYQGDMVASSPMPGNGLRKKQKRRGGYVPGSRPLVDFFIKLIETFQLTANAKFITSRPRYGNGRLQYDVY